MDTMEQRGWREMGIRSLDSIDTNYKGGDGFDQLMIIVTPIEQQP